MEITLLPGTRNGSVRAPASKSHAHRLLICAALGRDPISLRCDTVSADIDATAACLRALGTEISETVPGIFRVQPGTPAAEAILPCGESGSTLRFLLPVCGALGVSGQFRMEGRLPERPLAPLDAELERHGITLTRSSSTLRTEGRLCCGSYTIPGNISSQYLSGLLFALPLLDGDSTLTVTGSLESAGYLHMTEQALVQSGIRFTWEDGRFRIPGNQHYVLPSPCTVEGDCSGAAFFLVMGAWSPEGITVSNIPRNTMQGDRAILDLLRQFGAEVRESGSEVTVRRGQSLVCTVDAAPIPDLVPILAVLAAGSVGETRIVNAARLRLKESDRLESTAALLHSLGGSVTVLPDGLVIQGTGSLRGGTVNAYGDHRIAMAAAAAASICREPVIVPGCECTSKSFPGFWECYNRLERSR